MKYDNGKQYSGVFAGIECRFTLNNFSEKVVDEFNKELVNETKARISVEEIRPVVD